MHKNPLIIPILNILKAQRQAISEHELLMQLDKQAEFTATLTTEIDQSQDLALFQRHFLIMNALYQLQDDLLPEHIYLSISPLKIMLSPLHNKETKMPNNIDENPPLKAYYSDWANLEDIDEQAVEELLNSFWRGYAAADKRVDAYQRLGLSVEAPWAEVKIAYRRLVKLHHPDHGGNQQRFIEVRAAYEVLEQVLS